MSGIPPLTFSQSEPFERKRARDYESSDSSSQNPLNLSALFYTPRQLSPRLQSDSSEEGSGNESKNTRKTRAINKRVENRPRSRGPESGITLSIPIEIFIGNILEIKEIPYITWKKRIFDELDSRTHSAFRTNQPLSEVKIKNMVVEVISTSLKFSAICARVDKAATILTQIPEYYFLKQFEKCEEPELFWNLYTQLHLSQQKILAPMVGLKADDPETDAQKIITECIYPRKQAFAQECQEHVKDVAVKAPKEMHLINTSYQFTTGFDSCAPDLIPTPLYFIMPEDIRDTFRSFLTDDKKTKTLLIFNGEKIKRPIYGKMAEEERPHFLIKHLMAELHAKMGFNISSDQMMHVFYKKLDLEFENLEKACETAMLISFGKQITKEIINNFAKSVSEDLNDPEIIDIMEHYSDFCIHALSKAISDHQGIATWSQQAKAFAKAIYPRLFVLWEAEKNIPGFRLMQALSFGAFTTAEYFIRECLCPELTHEEIGNYHIKYSPKNLTRYNTRFDRENQNFSDTHIKVYTISWINGKKNGLREAELVANLLVHWTVSGNLRSRDFLAEFRAVDIKFAEKLSSKRREKILNKFHTTWPITIPWSGHLQINKVE